MSNAILYFSTLAILPRIDMLNLYHVQFRFNTIVSDLYWIFKKMLPAMSYQRW